MKPCIALAALATVSACSPSTSRTEPSLAPRAAESIDPRVPVGDGPPPATAADPGLARSVATAVERARAGMPTFDRLAAEAERAAGRAGGKGSDSWIAAQQVLSRLVSQKTLTEQAAGDVDEQGAARLKASGTIAPADRAAITAAQGEIARIDDAQTAVVERIRARLN